MPNWCDNYLTVNVYQDEVGRFLDHARRGEECFDFEPFVPRPATVRTPVVTSTDVLSPAEEVWVRMHRGTERNVTSATVLAHLFLSATEAELRTQFQGLVTPSFLTRTGHRK